MLYKEIRMPKVTTRTTVCYSGFPIPSLSSMQIFRRDCRAQCCCSPWPPLSLVTSSLRQVLVFLGVEGGDGPTDMCFVSSSMCFCCCWSFALMASSLCPR